MHRFRAELTDPRSLQHNAGIVESTLDDEHYRREFSPQLCQISGGAARAVIGTTGIQWSVITLPDAAASSINGSLHRPYGWLNGKIEVRVHYTSTTAGTATFNLSIILWYLRKGGSMLGAAVAATASAVAGPAVAYTEIEYPYLAPAIINPATQRISWRVARDGVADANNNPMNITAVVLTYKPAIGQ